ncbi:MAG: acetyl-CoA decarbonylase/synthase complex subunit gamma [Actinomycetota bacterium]|nr:acetyl-CoA decarbonylase/synthase complex subunit gamma [Actinomycetota bacterium]MCL6093396.1 acetyl-CoA decarbonylase/synthase complex subunit gamma [Actinomycetota bacterium]MDA8166737.1 acetyl-CoA decarbonylase/synthase complex subunit gamma [Actinomycetota bacterium]
MALSGLQIFKLLAKTNCKECGFPTCMAFAMQLAAGKAELDKCPYVSDEAKAALGEASAPPVRKVTVGAGDLAVTVGEETVMYRHEKRFEHMPGLGVMITDAMDDAQVDTLMRQLKEQQFNYVGRTLRPRVAAIKAADGAALAALAAKVDAGCGAALVLVSDDAAALKAAAEPLKDKKPLLYAASESNFDAVAAVARELDVPFAIKAGTLDKLAELGQKALDGDFKDVVLDPSSSSLGDVLMDQTLIRRSAVKKTFRALGFPTIGFPCNMTDDRMLEAVYASVFIAKYAGFVILSDLDPARTLPLLYLSQNIYTDPQKPMQMDQGIYPVNDPGPEAPIIVTTNFSLTYFTVSSEVEASKMPAWLAIMDVEGQSVLTAWAAGKFVADAIAPFLKKSGIEEKAPHKNVIIPGYVAQISGELEEELGDGWQVQVGVREAADIPKFLRQWSAA